jgi:hypothetical protein
MKGCKGICDRYPDDRPFGKAYRTHALCKRCDKWLRKTLLINDNCPCCNRKPKTMSKKERRRTAPRIAI